MWRWSGSSPVGVSSLSTYSTYTTAIVHISAPKPRFTVSAPLWWTAPCCAHNAPLMCSHWRQLKSHTSIKFRFMTLPFRRNGLSLSISKTSSEFRCFFVIFLQRQPSPKLTWVCTCSIAAGQEIEVLDCSIHDHDWGTDPNSGAYSIKGGSWLILVTLGVTTEEKKNSALSICCLWHVL